MNNQPVIHCFVTNDINQDQRMHRICTTMSSMNCSVILTGRLRKNSMPLLSLPFEQKRIKCFFNSGILFYLEYNLRILFQLLSNTPDVIYSVDTDTLPACTAAKIILRKKMIFDSHEFFTEVPELSNKPVKKAIWKFVEKICIPYADKSITVNKSLSEILSKEYKKEFIPVYNVPFLQNQSTVIHQNKNVILYQGVLNLGRGLEVLIDAMQWLPDICLVIAGEGDLSDSLRKQASSSPDCARITFTGWLTPEELNTLTSQAFLGLNLLENSSLNYYYSLANKFFDYMHAGVPSLNMDFPEYRHWLEKYETGYLVQELTPRSIADAVNQIVYDKATYDRKRLNCIQAAEKFNWENESIKISTIISDLLPKRQ